MFEGFELKMISLGDVTIRVRYGGSGPPVMLLHGHPRTHATWHRVAPLLAASYTVVCPDLRGYGKSSKPAFTADHTAYSKRAMAQDCISVMRALGHSKFAIVGHDRGAYVAFRAAMDFPDVVTKLAVLDGIPICDTLALCDARFALAWWHWFFFAQPEKPELAILSNPARWYGGCAEEMGREAFEDYLEAISDCYTVRAMLEDYRAALSVDRFHDEADRMVGRHLTCPVLSLWSREDQLNTLYGDVVAVWKAWAPTVVGKEINSGHHMAEEAPAELASDLHSFLASDLTSPLFQPQAPVTPVEKAS